jgi:hypothetical protein
MRLEYLNSDNGVEGAKRRWLKQIIEKFPNHDISYIPMLSDVEENDRQEVLDSFTIFVEGLGKNISVYNGTRKFDGNSKPYYMGNFFSGYKENDSKNEIIFIDADKGFYQLNVEEGHHRSKFTKNYLTMEMLDYLLCKSYQGLADDCLVIVYQVISEQITMEQYNPSGRTQIENVEHGLEEFINKEERSYLWYQSPNFTGNKLKFYFFSKKDWSEKLA